MTEAQIEQRRLQLAKSGGVCEVCGMTLTASTWQGAHRIANTQMNRAKWGSWIIDAPENIAIVCSLKCNQECNIGYDPGECLKIVEQVLKREKRKWK
jgi:hypothetical protein